jgi:aminobenzoyl-glutamate utilization protein B
LLRVYESLPSGDALKEKVLKWIDRNRSRFIGLSDKIWEYAEIGLQEFKSSSLLAGELEKAGFKMERGVAGMPTAFIATYGEGKPIIGILAEYDALPGLSQKKVPWKEPLVQGAPGHGCGHNIYGVSGLAGALAVKEVLEEGGVKGTIKFFGCPAEETLVGKVFMVMDGLFEGLDASISHHPGSMNAVNLASLTAMNSVKFHFYGLAAHAASTPEQGRSALDAVELMNIGANYLREHVVQEARIHYVVEDGGHEPNVIPPYARSWYYVRAPEREEVESIYARILDVAKGADLMAGTRHEIEFLSGCYNLLQNRALGELVVENMRSIGAPIFDSEELEFAREMGKSIPREEKRAALKRSKRPGWEELMDIDLDESIADPWGEGDVRGGSSDVGDVSWQTPTVEFNTAS